MDLRDVKEFLKDTLGYIIVAIVIFLIVVYVISFQQVIGPSMNSTLSDGDIITVNKALFRFRNVIRNDVIVIKHSEKLYIKRVIGLPGEHIEYKDNMLYINGKVFKEEFIKEKTADFNIEDLGYSTIPEGYYFVLGDNRTNSEDSRTFGLIKKDEIVGRASMRIWPINKLKFVK